MEQQGKLGDPEGKPQGRAEEAGAGREAGVRGSSLDSRGFWGKSGAETRRWKTKEDTGAKRAGSHRWQTQVGSERQRQDAGPGVEAADGHRCIGRHRQKDRQT